MSVAAPLDAGPPDASSVSRVPGGDGNRRLRGGILVYLARKVAGAIATLLFVLVFNFVLFRLMPGDPAKVLLRGRQISQERLDQLRAEMGLDLPWWQQFWPYLKQTFTGNLGISWSQGNRPVLDLILERLWPTVLLSGTALVLAAGIGMWLGARAGWRHNSRFDRITTSSTLTLYSVPEWWLGLLLILGLASTSGLGVFPTHGMTDIRSTLPAWLDVAYHMVLPVTALAVVYIAEYALIMRSSVLDERYSDYLTTARAKGLRDALVLRRHAVPNAMLPTVTLFFLSLGFVVSGAITVEYVFTWPGLGRLSAEALRGPDVPLLQGVFLFFSAGVILMNLLADMIYPLIDPRVRRS
jgi:peptide/nickel transport system permease protein